MPSSKIQISNGLVVYRREGRIVDSHFVSCLEKVGDSFGVGAGIFRLW